MDMITPHRTNWLTVVPEIHEEFFVFWHKIKPPKGLPTRDSYAENDLDRWAGHLHLVELIGDDDAKYLVYGSAIGKLHKRDWTGRKFSELEYEGPENAARLLSRRARRGPAPGACGECKRSVKIPPLVPSVHPVRGWHGYRPHHHGAQRPDRVSGGLDRRA